MQGAEGPPWRVRGPTEARLTVVPRRTGWRGRRAGEADGQAARGPRPAPRRRGRRGRRSPTRTSRAPGSRRPRRCRPRTAGRRAPSRRSSSGLAAAPEGRRAGGSRARPAIHPSTRARTHRPTRARTHPLPRAEQAWRGRQQLEVAATAQLVSSHQLRAARGDRRVWGRRQQGRRTPGKRIPNQLRCQRVGRAWSAARSHGGGVKGHGARGRTELWGGRACVRGPFSARPFAVVPARPGTCARARGRLERGARRGILCTRAAPAPTRGHRPSTSKSTSKEPSSCAAAMLPPNQPQRSVGGRRFQVPYRASTRLPTALAGVKPLTG